MANLESNLIAFFDKYQVSYNPGRSSFILTCPSCERDDHFWVRKSNGASICFRCGFKTGWKGLVASIAKCRHEDAWGVLFGGGAGDLVGKELDENLFSLPESEEVAVTDYPIDLSDLPSASCSDQAMEYLYNRDSTHAIRSFDIRYHEGMNAVVFPISRGGSIYGWQARKINPQPDEPRLFTSPGFNKARFLLNWDRVQSGCDFITIVEGPFDCVHADLSEAVGFGAVASLGKVVSNEQINLLLSHPAENILIGLDNDASQEVYKLAGAMVGKKNVFRILPPEHRGDFGECSVEEIVDSIENRTPIKGVADYFEAHFE